MQYIIRISHIYPTVEVCLRVFIHVCQLRSPVNFRWRANSSLDGIVPYLYVLGIILQELLDWKSTQLRTSNWRTKQRNVSQLRYNVDKTNGTEDTNFISNLIMRSSCSRREDEERVLARPSEIGLHFASVKYCQRSNKFQYLIDSS